jgi:hypothetical protein
MLSIISIVNTITELSLTFDRPKNQKLLPVSQIIFHELI